MSEDELIEAIEADKVKMEADLTDAMWGVLMSIGGHGRKERWKAGRSWPAYRGLEARGYVRRTEDDEDGRPTYALTKEGEDLYKRRTRPRVMLSDALFDPDAPDDGELDLPEGLFDDDE